MNKEKIISEEKLKEEVKKIRFGCGKELDEETYCGQDFWVCPACMRKLIEKTYFLKGFQEAQKQKDEEIKEKDNLIKEYKEEFDKDQDYILSLRQQLSEVNKIIDNMINNEIGKHSLTTNIAFRKFRIKVENRINLLAKGDVHTQRTKVTEPLDKADESGSRISSAPKEVLLHNLGSKSDELDSKKTAQNDFRTASAPKDFKLSPDFIGDNPNDMEIGTICPLKEDDICENCEKPEHWHDGNIGEHYGTCKYSKIEHKESKYCENFVASKDERSEE